MLNRPTPIEKDQLAAGMLMQAIHMALEVQMENLGADPSGTWFMLVIMIIDRMLRGGLPAEDLITLIEERAAEYERRFEPGT